MFSQKEKKSQQLRLGGGLRSVYIYVLVCCWCICLCLVGSGLVCVLIQRTERCTQWRNTGDFLVSGICWKVHQSSVRFSTLC